MEKKTHFVLHKKGKRFIVLGITTATFMTTGLMLNQTTSLSATTETPTEQTTPVTEDPAVSPVAEAKDTTKEPASTTTPAPTTTSTTTTTPVAPATTQSAAKAAPQAPATTSDIVVTVFDDTAGTSKEIKYPGKAGVDAAITADSVILEFFGKLPWPAQYNIDDSNSNFPTTPKFTDTPQSFNIHLTHKITHFDGTVNDDYYLAAHTDVKFIAVPTAEGLTAEQIEPEGVLDQTVIYVRNGDRDEITGEMKYTTWHLGEGQTLTDVHPIQVPGYTVNADDPINLTSAIGGFDTLDELIIDHLEKTYVPRPSEEKPSLVRALINYSINNYKGTVYYQDDTTGQQYGETTEVSGDYNTTNTYGIDLPDGYEFSPNQPDLTGNQLSFTFTTDNIKKVVHLQHKVVPVSPQNSTIETTTPLPGPSGKTYGDFLASTNKKVSELITYKYEEGTAADTDYTKELDFGRTVSVDLVTGEEVTSPLDTAWAPLETDTFKAVVSKVIPGFTADPLTVTEQAVTQDSKDLTFAVTYAADLPKGSAIVHYVYSDGTKAGSDGTFDGNVADKFDIDSPAIEGFKATTEKVTGQISQNQLENVFTVIYNKVEEPVKVPDTQVATVTYQDKAGKVLGTETFSGFSDTKIAFDTVNYIAAKLAGDTVVSDQTETAANFDNDLKTEQKYVVVVETPEVTTPTTPEVTTPTTPEVTTPTTPEVTTPTTPEVTTPTTGSPETVITPEVPETGEK